MTAVEQGQPETIEASQNGTAPPPRNVIEALAAVMRDLPGIGRSETSEQGYQYRGIESITRHAQHLLGRYGVVFVPRVERREVKDLTINGRPWTEDQAWIVYRVFGPGGVEDFIDVGPFVGLGRDNSDKGMNKCMTQAFKYALIQTLCIGDAKDDPDAEVAHEADARTAPIDPEKQARWDLGARIRALPPEGRDRVREFCDAESIPRVTAQMTDDQVERTSEVIDGLVIAAAQDEAAEAPQAPAGSPEADPAAEPSDDEKRAHRAAQTAKDAGIDAAKVVADAERHDRLRAEAESTVAELDAAGLRSTLASFGVEAGVRASEKAMRSLLVEAIVKEGMAETGDGGGDGALPLG